MIADELFCHGNGMVDHPYLVCTEGWICRFRVHDAAIAYKTNDINRITSMWLLIPKIIGQTVFNGVMNAGLSASFGWKGGDPLGSVVKKRRKKMRKHKHRKLLAKTRHQRRKGK
jgi:hypothetical protein